MPGSFSDARTRTRRNALTVLFAVFLATPLLAQAPRRDSRFSFEQKSLQRGGTIKVQAQNQELVREGVSILTGNVVIEYQDIKIQADKVSYDDRTRDITAEGHVVLDQGPQRLSAERVTYNMEARTGVLFNARGSFEPSIFFAGEKIEKIDQDTYILTNGVLTSCDITDPDWSFRLGYARITVDGYARLRNVSFFADRVPAFWLPYLLWPTKRDRALGLLIPRVGSNRDFGEYIENSLFIPMGQSMDLTLRGDFYSEGARRGGGIFRYVPSTEAEGEFEGYGVLDPERDKVEWKYEYTHTQEGLPGGFRAVIDVRDFSNLDFFKTFERDFEIRTLSSIYSSGYLTKNRPGYSLNIRADRRENLIAFQQSVVFEQLPTVQYTIYPTRIGTTPIYYNLESSTSHLRRKERRLTQVNANEYFRADFFPTLSMQLRTPPWISVKPQISLRETWYSSRIHETTRQIEDEPLSRFYGQGEVEFTGPSVSRIYDRSMGDFSRFKHVIEPRARYLYTSDVEKQSQVIQFDTVDSPLLPLVGQSVEYSLTNRIIAKQKAEGSSAREIMSITLRQAVSLDEPFSVSPLTGEEFFLTPLSLNVRVNPYQSVTFDSTATFGVESEQLDTLNMSANLRSSNRYLNFTWFASFLKPGQTTGKTSQFRVGVGSPIWRDRLRLDVGVNYDAERQEFQERRYASSFTASCWGITVERREYLGLGFQPGLTHDHVITLDLKNVGPLRGSF